MSFLTSLFGSRTKVPDLQTLDLGTEQGKAIKSNQANLPAAETLTSQANQFSTDQITKMLQTVIPGYQGLTETATGNIQSMLKGEIPADVSAQIQNSAAARSLGTGTAGSGMARNLVARDLGLTSLDLTQKGISSAQSWIGSMASLYEPSMMNVSSMFVTPAQQASFDVSERDSQWQVEYLKNQVEAMPDPTLTGIVRNIGSTIQGAMGGMGGGGGSSGGGGGLFG